MSQRSKGGSNINSTELVVPKLQLAVNNIIAVNVNDGWDDEMAIVKETSVTETAEDDGYGKVHSDLQILHLSKNVVFIHLS